MTSVCGRDAKKRKTCEHSGCKSELTDSTRRLCSVHDIQTRPESTSRQFNEWLDRLSDLNNETL